MSLLQRETGARTELTKESRSLLAKTAKKLDVQREVTRLTRNPAAGMMVRQLLFFDDKKKVCEDYWIFKSAKQWEQDEGLTRQQVRTATRKLEEFGLAQVDRDRPDPLYNNKTTFYRLDIYRVMQVVDPVKLEALEPELVYLEPEYDPDDDWLNDCERCGDEFCDGESCLYDETADGWHDEDTPDLTDEDAPEPIDDVDWLPEGFMATDAEHTNNQPLPVNQPTPDANSTNPLVESTNPMYRETTPEQLPQKNHKQKNSTLQVGEATLSRRSPQPDFQNQDGKVTTTPPSLEDPPDSNQREKVTVLTTSIQTTTPTREAVRALLLPGGKFHDYADTVLAEGDASLVQSLTKHVATEFPTMPENCHEQVMDVLMDMAKTRQEAVA